MATMRHKSYLSNAKIPSSKLNRLPSMSPIREEATPSPRPALKKRQPHTAGAPLSDNKWKVPSELEGLIFHYLSQPVLEESHLLAACPCCHDVNHQNREKRREAQNTGVLQPLSFPDEEPTRTPSPGTSQKEETRKNSGVASPPLMFRSDSADLLKQQHEENGQNKSVEQYTVDPLQNSLMRKQAPEPPVYKVRPRPVRDQLDDSAKSKLQKDIIKANSKYYASLNKLHGTIEKL